jgi:hypothetical protein
MRGRASSRGDARSGPPRKGDSTVPGTLRGVRPGSSGPSDSARFGAWGLGDLRSVAVDFGGWRVGGSVPLVVFGFLGLGIRCWVLGAVGRRESSWSRPWSRFAGAQGSGSRSVCGSGPEASRDKLQRGQRSKEERPPGFPRGVEFSRRAKRRSRRSGSYGRHRELILKGLVRGLGG